MSRNSRTSRAIDAESTVGIWFIQRELGRQTYGAARLVKYVRLLIEQFEFPPPLPELVTGRNGAPDTMTTAAVEHSVWRRAPVEAWIEDWLPPANAQALDLRAARAAAEEMDAAAGNLSLVGGREA